MHKVWIPPPLLPTLVAVCAFGGCSFTNGFEMPAVIGAWRNSAFTVNGEGTQRRRDSLVIEEDGTGQAIIHFTLSDDDSDSLYWETFDVAWARDGGEYLMELTCRETTAPLACTSVDMPCSLTSNERSLICYFSVLDAVIEFERSEEGVQ